MGELEAVLDAESRRHNRARVTDSEVELRGRPPYAELGAPMDPDVLDAEFDLGWLVTWWPQAYRRWGLVDLVSRAAVYSGGWTPFRWSLARGPAQAEVPSRVRIGWLGDHPDLDPARTGWPDPPQRYRLTTTGPAQELLDGVAELVGLLPSDDVAPPPAPVRWPDWVSQAFMAPRADVDWRAWHRETRRLTPDEAHRRRWCATWTRERWDKAMLPGERTWQWVGGVVESEHSVLVEVRRPGAYVSAASLTWLLHTAGATSCVPLGPG